MANRYASSRSGLVRLQFGKLTVLSLPKERTSPTRIKGVAKEQQYLRTIA